MARCKCGFRMPGRGRGVWTRASAAAWLRFERPGSSTTSADLEAAATSASKFGGRHIFSCLRPLKASGTLRNARAVPAEERSAEMSSAGRESATTPSGGSSRVRIEASVRAVWSALSLMLAVGRGSRSIALQTTDRSARWPLMRCDPHGRLKAMRITPASCCTACAFPAKTTQHLHHCAADTTCFASSNVILKSYWFNKDNDSVQMSVSTVKWCMENYVWTTDIHYTLNKRLFSTFAFLINLIK